MTARTPSGLESGERGSARASLRPALHGADTGAEPAATKEPLRAMTITLTDAEMVAMEDVMRVTALSQRAAFRQAIAGLQVRVREAVSGPIRDDRMPDFKPFMLRGLSYMDALNAAKATGCAIRRNHWCAPVVVWNGSRAMLDDEGQRRPQ